MAEDVFGLAVKLALAKNVQYVHGRSTCDEAGRPLFVYLCDYHQGYEAGLESMVERVYEAGYRQSVIDNA